MLKTLFALIVTTVLSANVYASSDAKACVAQILKNNTNGATAHLVVSCGTQTLAVNDIAEFKTLSINEIQELKKGLMFAVKELLHTNEAVSCFETDSELFWIGICQKL